MSFDQGMRVCRGCLASGRKMVNATSYEAEFKDLTGITISPSDRLPQWLCYECIALLQKCVTFRNKVKRSHGMLCQYVLEGVPFEFETPTVPLLSRTTIEYYDIPNTHTEQFTYNKHASPHLTRTSIEAYDFPAVQTEQVEVPIVNTALVNINVSAFTNIESINVKCEPVDENYAEHATEQECRVKSPHTDVTSKMSSLANRRYYMKNVGLVMMKHEEQIEQGELGQVRVKNESYDDDITIEEWRVNHQNEIYERGGKAKRDKHTEHHQSSVGVVRAGTHAARHSLRARDQLHNHTHNSSTAHVQDYGQNVQSNSSVNVNNSCNIVSSYVCGECNKCFSNKRLLIAHVRKHSKHKLYQCDICKRCYTHKGHFIVHYRTHTGDKPYKCDKCTKCYSHKGTFSIHYRTHTGYKPYKCDVCVKCFNSKNELIIHKRRHTGEKPFKCDVCMKGFCRSADLKIHHRVHTGEKPFKCDICMKSFSLKKACNVHRRIHTGDKPYQCDICMKRSNTKGDHDKHMRVHTGEKPYKCDACMKCFNDKGNLNKHVRICRYAPV